jgi:hypothetical protein
MRATHEVYLAQVVPPTQALRPRAAIPHGQSRLVLRLGGRGFLVPLQPHAGLDGLGAHGAGVPGLQAHAHAHGHTQLRNAKHDRDVERGETRNMTETWSVAKRET